MKKEMKKIKLLLVFLMLITVVGIVSNVSAAPDKLTSQSTITITGVAEGDKLAAYKILDAYKDTATNEITYDFTQNFKAFIQQSTNFSDLTVDEYYEKTSGNIENGSTQTNSTLDTLASAYAAYVRANSIEGQEMVTTGTTATVTAEAGTYMILPTEAKKVYAVMVANLDFKAENGEWVQNNANIVAKAEDVSLKKEVENNLKEISKSIGEDITYHLTGTIPKYPTNATNKTYKITDTLSTGLTHNGMNSIVIEDGETKLTVTAAGEVEDATGQKVGTITITGQTMTIDFTEIGRINSDEIKVTYTAKLNNQAIMGATGNTNEAKLVYANDPYGNGTKETESEEVKVYTYGLTIQKYEQGNRAKGLEGAEFAIYSDASLQGNPIGTIVTKADGTGSYEGLAVGDYYLKETKAPTGYVVAKDAIKVTVDKAGVDTTGYKTVEISNNKAGILPFTGGMGTIIYTVIGLAIIAGAAVGLVRYKKMQATRI